MSKLIKYGIGLDYVPKWGISEAFREIYQNFMDYGDFDTSTYVNNVTFENDFTPDGLDFLRLGNSKKHSESSRGKYGEGLKLALLVLLRNDVKVRIVFGPYVLSPASYIDEFLGSCFGINVEENDGEDDAFAHHFSITIENQKEAWGEFNETVVRDCDIIEKCGRVGNIVNKPIGNIYCGSLYVTNLKNLKHAYDISPKYLELGRDRDIPSSWSVEYYAAQILSKSKTINTADVNSREFANNEIPSVIAEKFEPVINSEGEVSSFVCDDVVIADPSKVNELTLIHKDKINKVRIGLVVKKRPYEYIKNLGRHIHSSGEVYYEEILERSKDWA